MFIYDNQHKQYRALSSDSLDLKVFNNLAIFIQKMLSVCFWVYMVTLLFVFPLFLWLFVYLYGRIGLFFLSGYPLSVLSYSLLVSYYMNLYRKMYEKNLPKNYCINEECFTLSNFMYRMVTNIEYCETLDYPTKSDSINSASSNHSSNHSSSSHSSKHSSYISSTLDEKIDTKSQNSDRNIDLDGNQDGLVDRIRMFFKEDTKEPIIQQFNQTVLKIK